VYAAGAACRDCEYNWDRLTIALLYLSAMWGIIRGIFEIVTAIQWRKEISNAWALSIGGILSICQVASSLHCCAMVLPP
jgi:uncharacterized membrane protein HdeD (DUF308 family)